VGRIKPGAAERPRSEPVCRGSGREPASVAECGGAALGFSARVRDSVRGGADRPPIPAQPWELIRRESNLSTRRAPSLPDHPLRLCPSHFVERVGMLHRIPGQGVEVKLETSQLRGLPQSDPTDIRPRVQLTVDPPVARRALKGRPRPSGTPYAPHFGQVTEVR
jgi:hypothetical protein